MSLLTDFQAKFAQFAADADKARAWVLGPFSGPGSIVDFGGGLTVKTIARLAAEVDAAVQFGVAGPVAWLPPVAWVTGLVCLVGPPATAVTYQNELYICTTAHTAGGAFDAAKFIKAVSTDGQLLTAQGDLLTRGAAALKRLARGVAGQVLGVVGNDLAWVTPTIFGGQRQMVAIGPLTSGLPSFLPTTSASRDLATQNISGGTPLLLGAANGFTLSGTVDRYCAIVASGSWLGLTASSRLYLFVTLNSDGSVTYGFTVLPPNRQLAGTPSIVNGQFTFNRVEAKGYMGDGTTAVPAYIVFVGEAVTDATTVTQTVMYAYRGLYDSGFTATLPALASATAKSHNLGHHPDAKAFEIECTTTDAGYAVGERLTQDDLFGFNATRYAPFALSTTRTTLSGITVDANTAFMTNHKTTGVPTALTLANWKWKMTARLEA